MNCFRHLPPLETIWRHYFFFRLCLALIALYLRFALDSPANPAIRSALFTFHNDSPYSHFVDFFDSFQAFFTDPFE
jgi:hypothetical protein